MQACTHAGQTGSGKTHTIMGERHEAGAIALAIDDIFATTAAAPADQFAFKVNIYTVEWQLHIVFSCVCAHLSVWLSDCQSVGRSFYLSICCFLSVLCLYASVHNRGSQQQSAVEAVTALYPSTAWAAMHLL